MSWTQVIIIYCYTILAIQSTNHVLLRNFYSAIDKISRERYFKRMPYHDLPNNQSGELQFSNVVWKPKPSSDSWSAADVLRETVFRGTPKGLVRLGELSQLIQQGISSRGVEQGELQVAFLRSSDIAPPSGVTGDTALVSKKLTRRLLRPGDILVPRVGVTGRADYVKTISQPLLASQELMTIRIKNPKHAPFIAAVLSTNSVKEQIARLAAASIIPTLTRNAIESLLVPDPNRQRVYPLLEELNAAQKSISEAESALTYIRAGVDRCFESAPTNIPTGFFRRVSQQHIPLDWGWKNMLHDGVIKDGQSRLKSIVQIDRLPGLKIQRGGLAKASPDLKRLNANGFRPQWYLALLDSFESDRKSDGKPGLELNRPALLLPMVGAIETPPIYVGENLMEQAGGTVVVPGNWGVMTDFPWLRSLAVVLDHSFVRLQRRLGSVVSTAPHLPMEALRQVVLPAIADKQWNLWETELQIIHHKLTTAAQTYMMVLNKIEELYHDAID